MPGRRNWLSDEVNVRRIFLLVAVAALLSVSVACESHGGLVPSAASPKPTPSATPSASPITSSTLSGSSAKSYAAFYDYEEGE
jgi:hypothetical protein